MKETPGFTESIRMIDSRYTLTRRGVWFRVGCHVNLWDHSSSGSLKIVAYVAHEGGTVYEALLLFGEYYRRVLGGEKGHPNIEALIAILERCGKNENLGPWIEFWQGVNPLNLIEE